MPETIKLERHFSLDEYLVLLFENNWKTMIVTGLLLRGIANAFPELDWLGKVVDVFAGAFGFLQGGSQ